MIFNTLSYIGEKLNENNVLWGVGASILLNQYDLAYEPNDIDILVHIKDIEKVDEILKNIGKKKVWEKEKTYSTKYFYEYVVNDIEIDVMSGLRINHGEGQYKHIFDSESISYRKEINNVSIPFTSLEDWYVIYQLIPKREKKVDFIGTYLRKNLVRKPELLIRALKGELPKDVVKNINGLLNL